MDDDRVTADDARAFWDSLTSGEQKVLCDIDARERDEVLLAKLEQRGMLFWTPPDASDQLRLAPQARNAIDGARVRSTGRFRLARELVQLLDSNCGDL